MKTEVLIENWDSVEVEDVLYIENTGDKLSRQLLSLVDSSKGNNYYDTDIRVAILSDGSITVETFLTNEYGSRWYNNNKTVIGKSDIPFFTAKKLGLM